MKNLILIPFLFSCLFSFGQLSKLKTEVNTLLENNKTDKALKIIETYIENPKNDSLDEAYILRARAYLQLQNVQEMMKSYDSATKINPKSYWAYYQRGHIYMQLQMFHEAYLDFSELFKCTDVDTLTSSAYSSLAQYYLHTRDNKKALECIEKSIEYRPHHFENMTNYAIILDDLGREEEAYKVLKQATEDNPDRFEGYINLGFNLTHLKRYEEALDAINKALEIQKDAYAYNNRALVYYYLKDYKNAEKDINTSLKMDPSNSFAYKHRAMVYLATNRKDEACEALNKAEDLGYTKIYDDEVKNLKEENCPR